MLFDTSFKPHRDGLTPHLAALMDRAFYARRPQSLNVQFVNEAGALDEWSFRDEKNRDVFTANLARHGIDFALSH